MYACPGRFSDKSMYVLMCNFNVKVKDVDVQFIMGEGYRGVPALSSLMFSGVSSLLPDFFLQIPDP
jgi:hypothetical protein